MEWSNTILGLLFLCLLRMSRCDNFIGDASICTPPTDPPSRPFPPFPKPVFETKLEINLLKPYILSIEAEQLVDQENIKLRTRYWFEGKAVLLLYAFQEAYTVYYPHCVTSRLDANNNTVVGGLHNVYIDDASFVLVDLPSLGLYLYEWEYVGQDEARGIPTDVWRTCLYYEPNNATYNAEFHFSVEGYGTASGIEQRPVRLKLMGQALNDTRPGEPSEMLDIEYYVEYMWFRAHGFVPDYLFQVPFGVYCPGSGRTRQLPNVFEQYKLRNELSLPQYSAFTYFDEWYDYSMNLTRIDYTSLGDSFDYGIMTTTTRIDDFNTGVMYLINTADGNCSIQSIPTTDTFGRPVGQGGSIRIATAAELFYVNDEYFYKGVFPFRDVDCDVYTEFREDLGNITFDWLMSSEGWTATEEGNAGITNIPIGLSVVTTEGNVTLFEYSVFDFNNIHPDTANFDIGRCFDGDDKARLQFYFEEKYENVSSNLQVFISLTQLTIAEAATISPIRVQDMQVDYDTTRVYVEFTMINRAPEGAVSNPVSETTLEDAIENLRTVINNGAFYVLQFQAEPNSLRDDVSLPDHIDFKGDKTVCEPEVPYNSMPMPLFPPNFQMKIEGKVQEGTKFTFEAEEYYNGRNRTAAIIYTEEGVNQHVIIDMKYKYLYRIQGSICSIVNYDSPERIAKIFPLSSLIQLRQGNEIYFGVQTIRGIPVNHWQSCIYWPKLSATFTVDWYFAKPEFLGATTSPQALIRTRVRGKAINLDDPSGPIRDFEHIYDYFAVRSDIYTDGDSPFLIPPGTVCTGDTFFNSIEFPIVPPYFTFKGEENVPNANYKFDFDEYYDYEYQLIRTDIKSTLKYSGYDGPVPTSYIDDYNTGVSHIIDLYHGICTIQMISGDPPSPGIDSTPPMIRTGSSIFFGKENLTFTYRGQYPHRELMANVWSTQVTYNEGTINESSWIVEVYYALESLQLVPIDGSVTAQQIPIHMEARKQNVNDEQLLLINAYDFRTNHPRSGTFDVSQCYRKSDNKRFQVTMASNYWSTIQMYEEWFKSAALITIAKHSGVSPVRIHAVTMTLSEFPNKVIMYFTMLVKSNLVEELSIDEAINSMETSVNSGSFVIRMNINGETTQVKGMENQGKSVYLFLVDPNSLQSYSVQSEAVADGYSVGAVVGVAVGTFLLSIILTVVIMLYVSKKKSDRRTPGGLPAQEITAEY